MISKKYGMDLVDNLLEVSVIGSFSKIGFGIRSKMYNYSLDYLDTSVKSTIDQNQGASPVTRLQSSESPISSIKKKPVAVITGFSSGIGLVTALSLARHGWQVIGIASNKERCHNALRTIRLASGPDGNLSESGENQDFLYDTHSDNRNIIPPDPLASYGITADISSLADVKAAAGFIGKNTHHISLIVHCAGKIYTKLTMTPEGFESTFALHVLGPHLLTNLLLEMMGSDPEIKDYTDSSSEYIPRIIWVSSGGMYGVKLDVDRLFNPYGYRYKSVVTYAYAKRMQVELAEIWAARLATKNCLAFSMHPGFVDTRAIQDGIPVFTKIMKPLLRNSAQGADTILYLSMLGKSVDLKSMNGSFFLDRKPRRTSFLRKTISPISQKISAFEAVEKIFLTA